MFLCWLYTKARKKGQDHKIWQWKHSNKFSYSEKKKKKLDRTQVIRLGGNHLYLLSHLSILSFTYLEAHCKHSFYLILDNATNTLALPYEKCKCWWCSSSLWAPINSNSFLIEFWNLSFRITQSSSILWFSLIFTNHFHHWLLILNMINFFFICPLSLEEDL